MSYLAVFFLVWYLVIIYVSLNGFWEIVSKFSRIKRRPPPSIGCDIEEDLPGVSILRPLKGIDTDMEQCLESSFLQTYPNHKYEIIFCVESSSDKSIPIVENLIRRYPQIDAKILISDILSETVDHFGPNPKINNLAKGYSHSKFDILWVLDSNVWTSCGTLIRSVSALQNSTDNERPTRRPVKLVHHAPLAVSINTKTYDNKFSQFTDMCGAKLDEMFLLTSHAKFYISLNNISLASCVNGKSNLYKKSDLDFAVSQIGLSKSQHKDDAIKYSKPGHGIRFFARYIGEDNMISEALWEHCDGRTGMTGDVVVQPLGGDNKIYDYIMRRVRWLRVRKYMVLVATLVEPTTESIVSGIFGTFAVSTLILGCAFSWVWFLLHLLIWFGIDYIQFHTLLKYAPLDQENKLLSEETKPYWIRTVIVPTVYGQAESKLQKFLNWSCFWVLRELLALPIWINAMSGHTIDWRNKPFKIRSDLSAAEL